MLTTIKRLLLCDGKLKVVPTYENVFDVILEA